MKPFIYLNIFWLIWLLDFRRWYNNVYWSADQLGCWFLTVFGWVNNHVLADKPPMATQELARHRCNSDWIAHNKSDIISPLLVIGTCFKKKKQQKVKCMSMWLDQSCRIWCSKSLEFLHLLHLSTGRMSKAKVSQSTTYSTILVNSLLQQHPAAHPTQILSFVERQPEGTILEGAE